MIKDARITVVGGGIHGLSVCLALKKRFPHLRLLLLDPWTSPLYLWKKRTKNCGSRVLRSPASHTIDEDFTSLLRFAKEKGIQRQSFTQPYFRPSFELFHEHLEYLLKMYEIPPLMQQARLISLRQRKSGWMLETNRGILYSPLVVLAIGSPALRLPPGETDHRLHAFHPTFRCAQGSTIAIVGGGITGVQLALLLTRNAERIELIHTRPLTVRPFDSNPCFIGPSCAHRFSALTSYRERRNCLHTQRYPGSIPEDLWKSLQQSLRENVNLHEDTVIRVTAQGLILKKGALLKADHILYATGFKQEVPQPSLVQALSHTYGLPLAACGFPIPQRHLEWKHGLYLTGALAELEIGPPARNIIGAHLALRRMIPALKELLDA